MLEKAPKTSSSKEICLYLLGLTIVLLPIAAIVIVVKLGYLPDGNQPLESWSDAILLLVGLLFYATMAPLFVVGPLVLFISKHFFKREELLLLRSGYVPLLSKIWIKIFDFIVR